MLAEGPLHNIQLRPYYRLQNGLDSTAIFDLETVSHCSETRIM